MMPVTSTVDRDHIQKQKNLFIRLLLFYGKRRIKKEVSELFEYCQQLLKNFPGTSSSMASIFFAALVTDKPPRLVQRSV
jgi:hypothetical protein